MKSLLETTVQEVARFIFTGDREGFSQLILAPKASPSYALMRNVLEGFRMFCRMSVARRELHGGIDLAFHTKDLRAYMVCKLAEVFEESGQGGGAGRMKIVVDFGNNAQGNIRTNGTGREKPQSSQVYSIEQSEEGRRVLHSAHRIGLLDVYACWDNERKQGIKNGSKGNDFEEAHPRKNMRLMGGYIHLSHLREKIGISSY